MPYPRSKRRQQDSSDNESGYSNRCSSLSPLVKTILGNPMILVQVGLQVFLINLRLSYLKYWMGILWHKTSISNQQALIGGHMQKIRCYTTQTNRHLPLRFTKTSNSIISLVVINYTKSHFSINLGFFDALKIRVNRQEKTTASEVAYAQLFVFFCRLSGSMIVS